MDPSKIKRILALIDPTLRGTDYTEALLQEVLQCPHCDFVDTHFSALASHLQSDHPELLASKQILLNENQYVDPGAKRILLCPYCTYAVGTATGSKDTSMICTHVSHCKANPTRSSGIAKVRFKSSIDQNLISSIIAKDKGQQRYQCGICRHLVFGSHDSLIAHYVREHTRPSLSSLPSDLRQAIENEIVLRSKRDTTSSRERVVIQEGKDTGHPTPALHARAAAVRPQARETSKLRTHSIASPCTDLAIQRHVLEALASTPIPVHLRVLYNDLPDSISIAFDAFEQALKQIEGDKLESDGPYWRILDTSTASEEHSSKHAGRALEPWPDDANHRIAKGHGEEGSSDSPPQTSTNATDTVADVSGSPARSNVDEIDARKADDETPQLEAEAHCEPSDNLTEPPRGDIVPADLAPPPSIAGALEWRFQINDNSNPLGPVSFRTLVSWAEQGRLGPNDLVVPPGAEPLKAREVSEFNMVAFVQLVDGRILGPVNPLAIGVLQSKGLVTRNPDDLSPTLGGT